MIPWVREKFAERRAKWLSNRKANRKSSTSDANSEIASTSHSHSPSPSTSSFTALSNNASSASSSVTQNNANTNTLLRSTNASQTNSVTNSTSIINTATRNTIVSVTSSHGQSLISSRNVSSLRNNIENLPPTTIICNHRHHDNNVTGSPIAITTVLTTTTTSSSNKYQNNAKAARRSLEESGNLSTSSEHILTASEIVKESIRVRIICPSGRLLSFQTEPYARLIDLKTEVLMEVSDDVTSLPLFAPDIRSLGPRFRLVKADYDGSELEEYETLNELSIYHNDLLILLLKRTIVQHVQSLTREIRGPSELDIHHVTRSSSTTNDEIPMVDLNEIFSQANLQFDIRKILISLAHASAEVIGLGPHAEKLIIMLKQRLFNKRRHENDTLQCLVEMGFTKDKAEYALKVHNNVYSSALEWLLQIPNTNSADGPLLDLQRSSSLSSPSIIDPDSNPLDNIMALCEIVRIYSHCHVPPTTDSIQWLTEMGFKEKDAIEALKNTCNNSAAACEWLCGNRSGSLIELRNGLSQSSPVLNMILQLPDIQLSLDDPKTLLALLSVLENDRSIRAWGNSETHSVITNILEKYQEEKHIMGINQFYSGR